MAITAWGDEAPQLDFTLEHHGSLILVTPASGGGREWLEDHTDGTWWGRSLVVEPRYMMTLALAIRESGFTIGRA